MEIGIWRDKHIAHKSTLQRTQPQPDQSGVGIRYSYFVLNDSQSIQSRYYWEMLPGVGQRNSCFCPPFFCFSRLRPLTYQMCLNLKKNFIFLSHPPGPPSPRAAAPRPGCPRGRAAWWSSRARGGWTAATGSCAPTESEKGRRKETILALEIVGVNDISPSLETLIFHIYQVATI